MQAGKRINHEIVSWFRRIQGWLYFFRREKETVIRRVLFLVSSLALDDSVLTQLFVKHICQSFHQQQSCVNALRPYGNISLPRNLYAWMLLLLLIWEVMLLYLYLFLLQQEKFMSSFMSLNIFPKTTETFFTIKLIVRETEHVVYLEATLQHFFFFCVFSLV